jgi:hypothetical protein
VVFLVVVLQPAAHGVEPGVELEQALLGLRIGHRGLRTQQQDDDGDDAGRDDQAEDDEDGFQHDFYLGAASIVIRPGVRTKGER